MVRPALLRTRHQVCFLHQRKTWRFVRRTDAISVDQVNSGMTASRWTLALLPRVRTGEGGT